MHITIFLFNVKSTLCFGKGAIIEGLQAHLLEHILF